eukprot:9488485-Pyramimonas_sp.AAC.1
MTSGVSDSSLIMATCQGIVSGCVRRSASRSGPLPRCALMPLAGEQLMGAPLRRLHPSPPLLPARQALPDPS